jgi:hypothetical protein
MEDILVDKDQWIEVYLGTAHTINSADDWKKLDRKAKREI